MSSSNDNHCGFFVLTLTKMMNSFASLIANDASSFAFWPEWPAADSQTVGSTPESATGRGYRCTLSEVYATIMSAFPYYRRPDIRRRWQNSVRHSLSFNDCFVRVPPAQTDGRGGGGSVRGACWTLHPDAGHMFADGCFLRRPQRFRSQRPKTVDVSTKKSRHRLSSSDGTEHSK